MFAERRAVNAEPSPNSSSHRHHNANGVSLHSEVLGA